MEIVQRELKLIRDGRGWFLKVLMREHLSGGRSEFGEIYVSASAAGGIKGNHFHQETTEWFCPIMGKGSIHTIDVDTGDRRSIVLDSDAPACLQIPPRLAHAVVGHSGSESFAILAYADRQYDPTDTDTYPFAVLDASRDQR